MEHRGEFGGGGCEGKEMEPGSLRRAWLVLRGDVCGLVRPPCMCTCELRVQVGSTTTPLSPRPRVVLGALAAASLQPSRAVQPSNPSRHQPSTPLQHRCRTKVMPSHGVGPGKTAPKLCYDFLIFDPIKSGNPNTLAKLPPPQGEGQAWKRSPDACTHRYILKESQSVPPPIDLREDGGAKHKVAVICRLCRIHADIYIDTTQSSRTCPTNAHPSHHFQLVHQDGDATHVEYGWQCSIEECGARLRVIYRLQRLQQHEIDNLTSPRLLKQRYDALMHENPGREGVEEATPMKALARLLRYTQDSLGAEQKTLPADNKRFQEAFGLRGGDFLQLFHRLGFKCEVSAWTMVGETKCS
jgi:hypothetical protein